MLNPKSESISNATEKEADKVRVKRKKWEDDELIYRGHILNVSKPNTTLAKEIWYTLGSKFKVDKEGPKTFLISKYFNFKFLDNIPLLSQVHDCK